MPATDSFTSTAAAVTTGVAVFSDPAGQVSQGYRQITPTGWVLTVDAAGVSLLKATTLANAQAGLAVTPTWPKSLDSVRELVEALRRVVT